ncbi:MAG: hypothetical protein HY645_05180 [Acidobacteria bacterium]|nr:hypothetical protein [Acidobacteriota bacterium]
MKSIVADAGCLAAATSKTTKEPRTMFEWFVWSAVGVVVVLFLFTSLAVLIGYLQYRA